MEKPRGPIKITGAEELAICTCMQSGHWPLCDGTHHTLSGAGPELIRLDKTRTYYFCGCYRTKNRPFCDGSHEKIQGKT